MYILIQVIVFATTFSLIFVIVRTNDIFDLNTLILNLNGIAWLYSTIGLIFGIISAFTIQTEWDKWDNLVNAVRGEISTLKQLVLLSSHAQEKLASQIKTNIKDYIKLVINEGWKKVDRGERSAELEDAIRILQESIYDLSQKNPNISQSAFSLFSEVINHRESRLHYSATRLPRILRITISFGTIIVIGLSFFIGVENVLLDYMFTMSIAMLTFLIYMVIKDLEHPYHPGGWHITNDDYKRLLEELSG